MALFTFALLALCLALAVAAGGKPDEFYLFVVRADCWDTFFTKFDLLNASCLKASISKALGYGIIAGSCLVKLPQVYNILKAGSVAGISDTSTYLELLSSVLAVVWHLWNGSPFSAYGESIIVGAGTAFVVALLWAYRPPGAVSALGWSALAAGCVALGFFSPAVIVAAASQLTATAIKPAALLDGVQYVGAVIFAASRVWQILAIAGEGSTGTLAVMTLLMNFAGTAARVFTSAQEVGNAVQLATTAFNALLNGILVGQWLWYSAIVAAPVKSKLK